MDDLLKEIEWLRQEIVSLRRDLRNFMVHASPPEHDFMGNLPTQTTADNTVTYIDEHDERDYEINGGSK